MLIFCNTQSAILEAIFSGMTSLVTGICWVVGLVALSTALWLAIWSDLASCVLLSSVSLLESDAVKRVLIDRRALE